MDDQVPDNIVVLPVAAPDPPPIENADAAPAEDQEPAIQQLAQPPEVI